MLKEAHMSATIAIIYPLAGFTLFAVLAIAIWQRREVMLAKQRSERSAFANSAARKRITR